MEIGFIGLGRMGKGMTALLLEKGHSVIGFDVNPDAVQELENSGGVGATSIEDLVKKLGDRSTGPEAVPRTVWIMVQRKLVQTVLDEIKPLLTKGDTLIEGGNTFYKETLERASVFKKIGVEYVDVGVSGGTEAARRGACLMIGGTKEAFIRLEPLFKDLAVKDGYGYMGGCGAGHFVKGIHNAIEYGMMASQAEGLSAIESIKDAFHTNLSDVLKVYQHGSIIESRLLEFLQSAWVKDPGLTSIAGVVPEGDTELEMQELAEQFALDTLESAILARRKTRKTPSFAGKIMAAQRGEFGGHRVEKEN
jgi:6-phosphogluconate dehydrogenase